MKIRLSTLLLSCFCLFGTGCEKKTPEQKHFESAERLRQSGYFADAAKEYLATLKIDPKNVNAHLALGNLYRQELNDRHKAIEHLQVVVKLAPKNPDGWENMLAIYEAQKNGSELAKILNAALKSGAFEGNSPRKRELQTWLEEVDQKLHEPPDGSIALDRPSLEALPGD